MKKKAQEQVKAYYELGWEKDRLSTGEGHASAVEGPIEKVRTLQLLEEFLPKKSCTILDIGGAAGAYSFWLAGLGHQVHLLDLTPVHIEQAKALQEQADSPKLASCQVGDACNLDFSDNFADVILCMGPLYHLPDSDDRKKCLSEAFRVLKPGGLLFAVSISRFVSLLDSFRIGAINNPQITAMIEHDIATGCHKNPTNDPMLFTTAYFAQPEEFRNEIAGVGFCNVDIIAIEGPLLFVKNIEKHWAHKESRERLLAFAKKVEREQSIMGMSNHVASVGYKF